MENDDRDELEHLYEVTDSPKRDMSVIEDEQEQIITDVLSNQSNDNIKDITSLFNLNIAKKNIIRVLKLNGLLDKLSDLAIERLINGDLADVDDKTLLAYISTIQKVVSSSTKEVDKINEIPNIQVNTQVNNINLTQEETMPRESREKVMDAVSQILAKLKSDTKETK